MTTRNPFDNLPTAIIPGNYGPSFKHGNYLVEVTLLLLKMSKNPKTLNKYFVSFEAVILQQYEGCFADSNEVGQKVSKVFMIEAAGWEGQYAMGNVKALVAAILNIDAELITVDHCMSMTGSTNTPTGFVPGDGTAAANMQVVIAVTDSDKSDDKGNVYTNLAFFPAV